MRRLRPRPPRAGAPTPISPGRFVVAASLLDAALFHAPLYRYALEHLDATSAHGWLTLLVLSGVLYAAAALPLVALAGTVPALLRPFCALVALANACAVHFVVTYGVVLDRAMMSNVLDTRSEESLELVHPALLAYVVLLGLLPAGAAMRCGWPHRAACACSDSVPARSSPCSSSRMPTPARGCGSTSTRSGSAG